LESSMSVKCSSTQPSNFEILGPTYRLKRRCFRSPIRGNRYVAATFAFARSDAKHSGLWVWCAKRRALLGSASCAVAAEASVQNYWRRQFCIVANNERRHTMRQEMRRQ
jgi:hypothetical protein